VAQLGRRDFSLQCPLVGVKLPSRRTIGKADSDPLRPSVVQFFGVGRFLHSITWSEMTNSVSGTVRPSALAVLRLMTSSNAVACCTGKWQAWRPSECARRIERRLGG
jgi:hypothetical protein